MISSSMKEFLKNEKQKLFKAKDYINSYYHQMGTSLESLRDNLFPYAFSPRLTWKDDIDRRSTLINVPNIKPQNLTADPEFNSNTLIAVINNLFAIQNAYCVNPNVIERTDVKLIKKAHVFLLAFLNEQFTPNHLESLSKQQKDLAFSLKQGIEERIQNTINPFFERLEMILDDEYRITLLEPIRMIVGTFQNYKKDTDLFDGMIAKKCSELGIRNNPELNLVIIADIEKSDQLIENEIKAKYEFQEGKKTGAKSFRLKEIAARYTSQADNIQRLISFLRDAERSLTHIPLFRRIILFFRNLFTHRQLEITHHNIVFSYVAAKGKIERKQTSLNALLKETVLYFDYLSKFREDLDFSGYTKTFNLQFAAEVERFIDTSFVSLNMIHEQCNGFREWLGREDNKQLLQRIPEKRQEEFNELLLHINRTCIVNNYNLHEIER